jgi:hypothetical protein
MQRTVRSLTTSFGAVVCCTVTTGEVWAQSGEQPTIRVGGLSYVQYEYQLNSAPAGQPAPNAFEITRAYLDVRATVPGGIGLRITSDVFRVNDTGSNANGSLGLRLKYGYATYTPTGSPLTFKLGLIHTPWLDWVEGMYGYRMQGTMPMERNHYFNSADLGAGVDGSWANQMVNMQVGVYNGEGYHGGAGDGRKDVAGRASVRLMGSDDHGSRGGLRLTGFGQYGKPTTGGTRFRAIGMLSYHSSRITLAAQAAAAADSVASDAALAKGRLFAGFGIYRVPNSPVAILARVDLFDPDTDTASDRTTRVIGGVSYDLSRNLRLLLDVDSVSYQSGATALTNGLLQMQFTF